jgi:hypothetical protein
MKKCHAVTSLDYFVKNVNAFNIMSHEGDHILTRESVNKTTNNKNSSDTHKPSS